MDYDMLRWHMRGRTRRLKIGKGPTLNRGHSGSRTVRAGIEKKCCCAKHAVVKAVKPTVLIGTSTHSRAFDEEIVREMASHVERPIIVSDLQAFSCASADRQFPMSNPTALCEVDPGRFRPT